MHNIIKHRSKNKIGGKWIIIAAVGTALGMLYAANRKRIMEQKTIREIWGEITDELESDYSKIRENISEAAHEAEEKARFLKKEYDDIVENTVNDFSHKRHWSRDAKQKLLSHLKDDWEKLRQKIQEGKDEIFK